MKITVITCAHNPRIHHYQRVLYALQNQSFPKENWEYIVVDNASKHPILDDFDFSWSENIRLIDEPRSGKTRALMKGLPEAKGEIIIIVDDDNVLDHYYLEKAWEINLKWPILGAFGGSCLPEYEAEPDHWFKQYESYLALRRVDRDSWGNTKEFALTMPFGAGVCFRSDVLKKYQHDVETDNIRIGLDRIGNNLGGCGDTDMIFTAIDMGYGVGLFKELSLTHLMPEFRVKDEYLFRLIRESMKSFIIFSHLRGMSLPSLPSRSQKLFDLYRNFFLSSRQRSIEKAQLDGMKDGLDFISSLASR